MLVFQLRVIAAEKKPKKIWSTGAIQKAIGPGCSEGLARHILKNTEAGKISQKVAAVKASLHKISKFIDYYNLEYLIDRNDHFVKMFADYPDRFAALAKFLGKGAYESFRSFEYIDGKIEAIANRHPDQFFKMIQSCGILPYEALKDEKISRLFDRYPERFVEIAKAVKGSLNEALLFLGNDAIRPLFEKDPNKTIRQFAQLSPYNGSSVFGLLNNRQKIFELYVKNPDKMVDILRDVGKAKHDPFISLLNTEDLFIRYPERFAEITRVIPEGASDFFVSLENRSMTDLFEKNPKMLIRALAQMKRIVRNNLDEAMELLSDEKVCDRFVKGPIALINIFSEIDKTGEGGHEVFSWMNREKTIRKLFAEHPDKFANISKATGAKAYLVIKSFYNPYFRRQFKKYISGQLTIGQLVADIFSSDNAAIEGGRFLDVFHNNPAKRKAYLKKLTAPQVLGILCSNPEFFYTSTNHMLFDRLKKDIGKMSMSDIFAQYKMRPNQIRNFMFRAIYYGRFCGSKDCLFKEGDMQKMMGILLEPVKSDRFSSKYYFLLANALEEIRGIPHLFASVRKKIESRLRETYGIEFPFVTGDAMDLAGTGWKTTAENRNSAADIPHIVPGLQYILYKIDPETPFVPNDLKVRISSIGEKGVYDPSLYKGRDGKITIVQVFNKRDSEKSHWNLSRAWFRKYGKEASGPKGERIYETKSARIILYMGKDEENRDFVARQLKNQPNTIMTFRGHSYSLNGSFPRNIFGNSPSHVLFIPGSCGSAGSTAQFIATNPKTDIRFFSNTSTGRGQVTNALLDAIIASPKPVSFHRIVNKARIEKFGGNPKTIKTWSSGEALMKYIYGR